MKVYMLVSAILIGFLLFRELKSEPPKDNLEVIRTKGIIVVDESGNDRILIGAPIPDSKSRIAEDTARVRSEWASNEFIQQLYGNPEKYMDAYKKAHHGANGIVIMNEDGFDRVLLGENLADPNLGKRFGRSTGLSFNDEKGFEKGGIGMNRLPNDMGYRTVVGLDHEGGEAIHMAALEDGSKAFRIANEQGYILMGLTETKHPLFGVDKPFGGLIVRDSTNSDLYELNILSKKK